MTTAVTAGAAGRGGAGGPGMMSRTIDWRQVGVRVDVVTRVLPDGRIAVDLKIDDSRMSQPNGEDAPGVMAMESFKGTVVVKPNEPTLVADDTKGKGPRTAYVLSARVKGDGAK